MNASSLHDRIETILAHRLRVAGFDRHAAQEFARGAASEILPALHEPTREMCLAAYDACIGLPRAADYWRAMVTAAEAAIPKSATPRTGDLFQPIEAAE